MKGNRNNFVFVTGNDEFLFFLKLAFMKKRLLILISLSISYALHKYHMMVYPDVVIYHHNPL